jgi:hypothetical protein
VTAQQEYQRDLAQYIRWVCISTDESGNLAPLSTYEKRLVDDHKYRLAEKYAKKYGVSIDEVMTFVNSD